MAAPPHLDQELQTSIQYVKGVGPRLAQRFANRGIHTVADALFLLPRRYQDRRRVYTVATLEPDAQACLTAEVLEFGVRRTGARRRMFELVLGDETGRIVARWFNANPRSFGKRFQRGERLRVAGKVQVYRGQHQFVHPDVEKISAGEEAASSGDFAAIVPVYPEIEGIYPKSLRRIVRRVVERYADKLEEILPDEIRTRHGLPPVHQALRQVHFPPREADVEAYNRGRSPAHRRVVFEEFFMLQLGLALRRGRWRSQAGCSLAPGRDLENLARGLFGFDLTGAQKRVLGELAADMAATAPMNRLLQGDVGSGKTAVAILAVFLAVGAGAQAALMAPTEILAEQHHRNLEAMLDRAGAPLEVAFLSSSVKGAARREILGRVAVGKVDLLVGTHALIEEAVRFARLGLCIIDEQHRFGVMQRARLRHKAGTSRVPDVLVMTATPIPRTLAMTLYGDLDVSILDEMPPGRSPVRTVVLEGKARAAYLHVRREVESGGQAYLVYPLVDESDKVELRDATGMFERLQRGALAGLRLGLLHGRMQPADKDEVMRRFARGALDVLVATSVVEVGVDVPRATVMVVEHAERFGLSQLHQLRGRVGRGSRPGTCYLVAHATGSPEARSRLGVMEKSNDGFLIAEEDLAIRGPGEFLGTRQSGVPALLFGDLARDADLLEAARREAFDLIERDPHLAAPAHAGLRRMLQLRWGQRLRLAEVG